MTSMRDASESVIMSGFFEEVQRRKVYRVAAAYIIAAGFIIQIGSAVFPAWELPNWAFRLVVVLLLVGFPIAAVRDLKVISRTSTAKYQSKPDNLKTVAQELGVSTILEGAVQKAGDKVRVNVQLLDARADTH